MTFEAAIRWLAIYVTLGAIFLALAIWSVYKADDPKGMIYKWILTFPLLGFMIFFVANLVGQGGYVGAFVGIPLTAVCGLILAIIWVPNLVELVSSPISSLYDGGNVPPEPKPAYSIAIAKQKAAKYQEAIFEIQKQLAIFPRDLEGHMLIATIQAENFKDLDAAEETVMNFVSQPDHAPKNIVYALYAVADWRLKAHDKEGAERALRKVLELLPGTEFELGAAQRLAHLSEVTGPFGHDREKTFNVPEGIPNLGLLREEARLGTAEEDRNALANEYVRHLEVHPHDTEIREKLAMLYMDHYGRLDMAQVQLEEIIRTPNQPHRIAAHCLNLMADMQVRGGADYETVKGTLERIINLAPTFAAAENARRRISLLKLELKARGEKTAVKMGDYEQNIGLKSGRWGAQGPEC